MLYQLILSTSSGKDRLDVFYQLDLSTASGKDRLDSRSLGGEGEFRGRLDIEAIYGCTLQCNKGARLRQGTETLEAGDRHAYSMQVRVADLPGTPAEGHSSLLVLGHSN